MNRQELYEHIKEKQPNICQISVLQNGNEIYSAQWNGYQRADCTHIMSATKSIVSLLVGIDVDQGMIGSVEDQVLSYFPEYSVKRGEKTIYDVTVRHLLTMRAPYKGHGDPWTKVCSSEDWTAASLDFLGGRRGITGDFDYRTVCLHILSGLLYKATGMKTVDFANRFLFRPLGIPEHENYFAETAAEHKQFTLTKLPSKPAVDKLEGGNYGLFDLIIRHNTLKGYGRMMENIQMPGAFPALHGCADSRFRGIPADCRMLLPGFRLWAPNTDGNYDVRLRRTSGKRPVGEYGSWVPGIMPYPQPAIDLSIR